MIDDAVTNKNHGLLESKAESSSQRLLGEGQNRSGIDIIGTSGTLDRVLGQVEIVAATDSTAAHFWEKPALEKTSLPGRFTNLSSRRQRQFWSEPTAHPFQRDFLKANSSVTRKAHLPVPSHEILGASS